MGHGVVDSALGRRFLRVDARNCTTREVVLKQPVLTGETASGRRGTLRVTATPVAGRPDEPLVLPPGGTACAGIAWRAAPRSGRLVELRLVTGAREDLPDLLTLDVLDLRLDSRIDHYPWTRDPEGVF
ncbi:DUF4232 domain-containing protein [Nocardioides perillae]|uniref:Uncharacterized protein n=1 Tax=Nocardioides perillae TaxID=1119534 RepID=A0A7Y9RT09_9ACTN|nr:DUF4232 domain-containing protein [Nocardioides perillae]NYG54128.1 hypothetical protein [Nocardioides perillae]